MQRNQNSARLGNYLQRFTVAGIALVLSAILFTSCSSSPSESQAETILDQQVTTQSGGKIILVSFRKTNGMEAEVMGVKTYQLAYEAKVRFTADGTWQRGPMAVSYNFSTERAAPGSISDMLAGISGNTPVRSGSEATIEGTMIAQKTEKGWQFMAGDSHVTKEPGK